MKKIISTFALLAITFTGFAQDESSSEYKPKKGTITTEVGLSGGLFDSDYFLTNGVAKFRYFLKNDLAVRFGVGIGSRSDENSTPQSVAPAAPVPITTEIQKFGNKTFNLGIEKHFAGSDRLSTYAGLDLIIGFNSASLEESTDNGIFDNIDGATSTTGANRAGSSFGVRVVTGADYYIAKKVYLGVELGLSYSSLSTDAVTRSEKTTTAGPIVESNLFAEGKGSRTNTNIIGGVKIGYQF